MGTDFVSLYDRERVENLLYAALAFVCLFFFFLLQGWHCGAACSAMPAFVSV